MYNDLVVKMPQLLKKLKIPHKDNIIFNSMMEPKSPRVSQVLKCLLGHDIDRSICGCSICIHMWEHVCGGYHTYGKGNGDTN